MTAADKRHHRDCDLERIIGFIRRERCRCVPLGDGDSLTCSRCYALESAERFDLDA